MRTGLEFFKLAVVTVPLARAQFGMPPKQRSSPVKGEGVQLLHSILKCSQLTTVAGVGGVQEQTSLRTSLHLLRANSQDGLPSVGVQWRVVHSQQAVVLIQGVWGGTYVLYECVGMSGLFFREGIR